MDYSKSVIYEIQCLNPDIKEKYIGSTANFQDRCWRHRDRWCNEKLKYYHHDVYKFIRDNRGIDNFEIKIIQNYPCETELELKKEEQRHIDLNGGIANLLNMINAHANDEVKRLSKNAQGKRWREKHAEENSIKASSKRKNIKENEPEKYKAMLEEGNKKTKLYYAKNKEQIDEKRLQKIDCPCGGKYIMNKKKRHFDTPKHKKFFTSS